MFENLFDNSIFGKIGEGMCKLTVKGQIAVKTSTGFKSWDVANKRLTNQSNFVFDVGSNMFFIIPTNKVKVGDIILVQGRPRCVVSADKDRIEAVNYEDSTLDTILPEHHVFMGNTYFYGKIVCPFGSSFVTKKGSNNLMKMAIKMQMLQSFMGKNNSSGNSNDLVTMMMMSSMFGGNSEFGDMFEGMFDFDEDDDDENILNNSDEENDASENGSDKSEK